MEIRWMLDVSRSGLEAQRLAALDEFRLLDTEDEAEFDELVALAAEVCSVPMSSFTLIASDRAWSKATYGLAGMKDNARDVSFCTHAIDQDDLLIVEDATLDERFRDNIFVTGEPSIRFYAAVPLAGLRGAHLGTLCVIDVVPRTLTASQCKGLRVLAMQVQGRMEMRVQQRRLREALAVQQRLVAELASSEDRFRTFMDVAPAMIYIKDEAGRFVFYNEGVAKTFAVSRADLLGLSDHDLFPAALADVYRKNDLEAIAGGTVVERLEDTQDASGTVTRWRSHKFPWRNGQGEVMLGGISMDVTNEVQQQHKLEALCAELERLAAVDALTGLANRRALDERVEVEFQLARRHKTVLSVVLLDIDNFKRCNDEFGHAAGDRVLRQMGKVIQRTARATDVAARFGGEEFVVLLPNTEQPGALLFAQRIQAAIRAEPWPFGPVTASIGTASLNHWTGSAARLIELADDAMYEVKCTGKDRVLSHQELMGEVPNAWNRRGSRLQASGRVGA